MCFRNGLLILNSFQKIGTKARTGFLNQVNHGLLSREDRGDRFTEPTVYRSKGNISKHLNSANRVKKLLFNERVHQDIAKLRIPTKSEIEIALGSRLPLSPEEKKLSMYQDSAALQLTEPSKAAREVISTKTRSILHSETDRRNHVMDKFGEAPSARDFQNLLQKLREDNEDEETIRNYQVRLTEESGVYPSTRLDAYMLGDEVCFPEWVRALPYRIRDQVKYGNLGITEFDETLRTRLGRLSRDERIKEWDRIKKAKEYQIAKEETLTLSELRDMRQGKRRYHWLLRKRQRRASSLRRLSLRKPNTFEVWPAGMVDYSQRVAFIAQHVENAVKTMGQWPLDEEELLRAKRKRTEAQHTFVNRTETPSSPPSEIADLLHAFDTKAKSFKRLSRKAYAKRVNAVVHGDQDEYGRKYRHSQRKASHRERAFESFEEIRLDKELRSEPAPSFPGKNNTDDFHWPKHTRSWVEGMPSSRYGS